MRRFDRRRAAVLASAIGIAVSACGLLVPLEHAPRVRVDGGEERDTTPAPDASVDPCGTLPAPPSPRYAPDGRSPLRFAAYVWDFRHGIEGLTCATPGHDLDGRVTSGTDCREGASCLAAQGAPVSTCDQAGGVDNALERLFTLAESTTGRPPTAFDPNVGLTRGLSNLLLEIVHYSGEPDDEDVLVNFLAASGMEGIDAGDRSSLTFPDLQRMPEVWDGGQDAAWVLEGRTAFKQGPVVLPRFSGKGFVKDGVLVVPETGPGILPLLFDGRGLPYEGGIFSAKVVTSASGHYALTHVRLGVRARSADFLTLAAGVDGPSFVPDSFCAKGASEDFYIAFFRPAVCAALDLLPSSVPPDPNAACARLSIGVTLAFSETRFVEETPGTPLIETLPIRRPCADEDAGTEWCDDCAWPSPRTCSFRDAGADSD